MTLLPGRCRGPARSGVLLYCAVSILRLRVTVILLGAMAAMLFSHPSEGVIRLWVTLPTIQAATKQMKCVNGIRIVAGVSCSFARKQCGHDDVNHGCELVEQSSSFVVHRTQRVSAMGGEVCVSILPRTSVLVERSLCLDATLLEARLSVVVIVERQSQTPKKARQVALVALLAGREQGVLPQEDPTAPALQEPAQVIWCASSNMPPKTTEAVLLATVTSGYRSIWMLSATEGFRRAVLVISIAFEVARVSIAWYHPDTGRWRGILPTG